MLESREFSDAHIVFIHDQNIIFGVQQDGELSAFGGRSEHNETLLFTLLREYVEESHESIITVAQLCPLLKQSKTLHYKKRGGKFSCTVFVHLDTFDFETARTVFLSTAAVSWKRSYKEMKDLFILPMKEVLERLQTGERGRIRQPTFNTLKRAVESALLTK